MLLATKFTPSILYSYAPVPPAPVTSIVAFGAVHVIIDVTAADDVTSLGSAIVIGNVLLQLNSSYTVTT